MVLVQDPRADKMFALQLEEGCVSSYIAVELTQIFGRRAHGIDLEP